jgi:hypothetical protein
MRDTLCHCQTADEYARSAHQLEIPLRQREHLVRQALSQVTQHVISKMRVPMRSELCCRWMHRFVVVLCCTLTLVHLFDTEAFVFTSEV